MRREGMIHAAGIVAVAITACSSAVAFDAKGQAQTVAPYVDEGTVFIGRLDLTKIRLAESFQTLAKFLPVPKDRLHALRTLLEQRYLKPLRAQQVSEIYALVSLNDLPAGEPFLIVPVGHGGDHRKVAGILFSGNPDGPTTRSEAQGRQPGPFEDCTRLGNAVFCGRLDTLQRLKSLKPSPRKHLAASLQSVETAAVQLVFVPSADHHRVVAEVMPNLPKEFGGLSGKKISQALQWAALGVDLTPKLKATLIVQAARPELAEKLKATVLSLKNLKLKATPEEPHDMLYNFLQIPALLGPKVHGSRLTFSFDADTPAGRKILATVTAVGISARSVVRQSSSRSNLKQLGLAMHNFHDVHGGFPPTASYDKKGKRLLSWRVYLLPYLDQQNLFEQFRLNEPWDSPHNRKLIARMPAVFADPSNTVKQPGMTRYVAPVGPKHIFDGKPEGVRIRDITDGTSNTILIVEAAPEKAVVWTKPDDLNIDHKNPLQGLLGKKAQGFQALFADGSVRLIPKTVALKTLRGLFTRNGGEAINDGP